MERAEAKRNHMLKYLNLESYAKMQDEIKAQLHKTWRNDPQITTDQVQKALGLTTTSYYKELDRLGVEYSRRKPRQRRKAADPPKKLESSCEISFNGTYDPMQLLDQIEGLKSMIDVKALGYTFNFSLVKITEN